MSPANSALPSSHNPGNTRERQHSVGTRRERLIVSVHQGMPADFLLRASRAGEGNLRQQLRKSVKVFAFHLGGPAEFRQNTQVEVWLGCVVQKERGRVMAARGPGSESGIVLKPAADLTISIAVFDRDR